MEADSVHQVLVLQARYTLESNPSAVCVLARMRVQGGCYVLICPPTMTDCRIKCVGPMLRTFYGSNQFMIYPVTGQKSSLRSEERVSTALDTEVQLR
jgi:hypothetical protein